MILWLYVSFLPLPVVFSPGEDYDFLLGVIEQLSFLDLPSILVASRHVLQDVMCVHVCTRVDGVGGGDWGWVRKGKEKGGRFGVVLFLTLDQIELKTLSADD